MRDIKISSLLIDDEGIENGDLQKANYEMNCGIIDVFQCVRTVLDNE